jgi:hypothetical protein
MCRKRNAVGKSLFENDLPMTLYLTICATLFHLTTEWLGDEWNGREKNQYSYFKTALVFWHEISKGKVEVDFSLTSLFAVIRLFSDIVHPCCANIRWRAGREMENVRQQYSLHVNSVEPSVCRRYYNPYCFKKQWVITWYQRLIHYRGFRYSVGGSGGILTRAMSYYIKHLKALFSISLIWEPTLGTTSLEDLHD